MSAYYVSRLFRQEEKVNQRIVCQWLMPTKKYLNQIDTCEIENTKESIQSYPALEKTLSLYVVINDHILTNTEDVHLGVFFYCVANKVITHTCVRVCIYQPPLHKQDATQGQFSAEFNRFNIFPYSWCENNWIHIFPLSISTMWDKQLRPGFELGSPCSFPTTKSFTPRATPVYVYVCVCVCVVENSVIYDNPYELAAQFKFSW